MRVLSLDPGLAHTAAVLFHNEQIIAIDVFDTVKDSSRWTTAAESDQHRVEMIAKNLSELISKWKPDLVCAEQPVAGAKSAAALKALSMIASILYVFPVIHPSKIPWVFIRVHDIKQAVLNKRKATTKVEMIEAIIKRYPDISTHKLIASARSATGYAGSAEHVADAIAVFEALKLTAPYKVMAGRGGA